MHWSRYRTFAWFNFVNMSIFLKLQLLWKAQMLMWLQQGKPALNSTGTRFLLMISRAFSPITPFSTRQETIGNVRRISSDCWCIFALLSSLLLRVVAQFHWKTWISISCKEVQRPFVANDLIWSAAVGVPSNTYSYKLTTLTSDRHYVVHIMVSNQKGSKNGSESSFYTKKYGM